MPEGVAAGIHNNLETLRGRRGVSILELWELFPDDDHAEAQHPPTRQVRPEVAVILRVHDEAADNQ